MSANHLAETTVNMMIQYIQANIDAALDAVQTDTSSYKSIDHVTLESPRSYFIYPKIKGYQTPAVMVIVDDFDFRPSIKGANHINASVRTSVAVLLEDRDEERLTIKAYRYLDAFHKVLEQAEVEDASIGVKIVIIVNRALFTPHYTDAGSDSQGLFRKELQLECAVEHYSNF